MRRGCSLILLILATLCGTQRTLAQETDVCDPKDGLTRGPLQFSDLTGNSIECTRTEDRNGVKWRYFHLQASGGSFVFTGNREVVRATITSLDLQAGRTFKGNSPIPIFEIAPNGLTLKIVLDHPITEKVFGGTMQVDKGTELEFTNDAKVVINGAAKVGQSGSLKTVASSVSLRNSQVSLSGLPTPLLANLGGQDIALRLSLATGAVKIRSGILNGHFAKQNPTVPFEFGTADYRCLISRMVVPTVQLKVDPTTVVASLGSLKATGELAAIIDHDDKLPLLLRGVVEAAETTGNAPNTDGTLEVSKIRVRDLRFTPAKTVNISDAVYPTPKQREFLIQLGLTALTASQQAAIDDGAATLKAHSPDLLIDVTPDYLKPALISNASKVGLNASQIYFGQQEVLALATSLGAAGSGSSDFVLRLSPSVVGNQLKVRYVVDNMSIEQYREQKWKQVADVIKDLRDRAKAIEDAASDPNAAQLVDLPMVFSNSFDVNFSTTDPSTGLLVKAVGNRLNLTATITSAAILLDTDGLHLLASVDVK